MIELKCVNRIQNTDGVIMGFSLADKNGNIVAVVTYDEARKVLKSKMFNIKNMALSVDDRVRSIKKDMQIKRLENTECFKYVRELKQSLNNAVSEQIKNIIQTVQAEQPKETEPADTVQAEQPKEI